MKKYWPFIIGGFVVILIIGGIIAYKTFSSDNGDSNGGNKQNNSVSIDFNRPVCDQISKSDVSSAIGQNIVKTEPISSTTSNVCQYYINDTNFVTLRLNKLNYEAQKQGQINLDRQISTNSQINTEHFVAIQKDGLINDIVIKINDNLFLTVDRSSTKAANEETIVALAAKVAELLKTGTTTSSTDNSNQVSQNDDEQFIRNFFGLIEDKKASEAVMIMTSKNTTDDSIKQAWGVQFNNMNSVKVVSIEPSMQESWSESSRQYKVVLDMVMNPNSANEPIPYYGYENGQNTRFINLLKENGAWRVDGIATGP